jgi:aerobic carbon-monoxide dehydrogenase medium subunit
MKPGLFAYAAPRSLEETLSLLREHGDEAKILAGGQSLIPLLNMRLAMPELLVDINNIAGQNEIEDNARLSIGPLVRQSELERAPGLAARHPLLADAIRWVGHSQIRNRGTVLGSLAHADPAAELPVAFQAMEGEMEIDGSRGRRVIPAVDFFVHVMTTAIEPDEMLVRASVSRRTGDAGSAFLEVARRHGDFAVASVAVVLTREEDSCRAVRIAMGGVGPVPLRARRAEQALEGANVDTRAFDGAAELAAAEAEPVSDVHGTVEYRRDLVRTLVRRALAKAADRANSGQQTATK